MLFLLDWDGYWHCDPWFFMLFWTMTDITKFYKLWSRIYYHWLLGHDGYYHFPRIVTKASFLLFPQRWQVFPCICNIVFLCVLNCERLLTTNSIMWATSLKFINVPSRCLLNGLVFICRMVWFLFVEWFGFYFSNGPVFSIVVFLGKVLLPNICLSTNITLYLSKAKQAFIVQIRFHSF
jgi:hypothetical protein